jgi:hypothetical protein
MLPFSFIGQGTYTNPASLVSVNVALNDQPDWFFVKDLTNWGAQNTAANPIYAEWFSNMAPGAYLALGQPSSTTTGVTTYASQGSTGGFTFLDPSNPTIYSTLPATTVNDTTFVVSMASTAGLNVGDTVRLTNVTGMLQISGMTFQITAISPSSSITLGYMATAVSAGLTIAANGTAATVRKVIPSSYYPRLRFIAYITQATQAKVYFTAPNDFTPGEIVDFNIPTAYGMTQLSFLTSQPGGAARVLTVTNSATESSIVINVNTTGDTAFTYPASASFTTVASPATCFPAGSGIVPLNGSATVPQSPPGTNLQDAFDNRGQYIMNIGTSACGVASAKMQWFAFKADYSTLSNA